MTGANAHDVTQALELVDAIPAVKGKRGRPRKRPLQAQGDRGYDSEPVRKELKKRHIWPLLAKRGEPHGSGLGVHRWVVERSLSWLHQFRRLRVRYERRADIHEAFLAIGCAEGMTSSALAFCSNNGFVRRSKWRGNMDKFHATEKFKTRGNGQLFPSRRCVFI